MRAKPRSHSRPQWKACRSGEFLKEWSGSTNSSWKAIGPGQSATSLASGSCPGEEKISRKNTLSSRAAYLRFSDDVRVCGLSTQSTRDRLPGQEDLGAGKEFGEVHCGHIRDSREGAGRSCRVHQRRLSRNCSLGTWEDERASGISGRGKAHAPRLEGRYHGTAGP